MPFTIGNIELGFQSINVDATVVSGDLTIEPNDAREFELTDFTADFNLLLAFNTAETIKIRFVNSDGSAHTCTYSTGMDSGTTTIGAGQSKIITYVNFNGTFYSTEVSGSGGLTNSTIDFTTSGDSIIDEDLQGSPYTITDTSQPASPNYTKTITGIPTNANVIQWGVYITACIQNTGIVPRDINWSLTLNGTDLDIGNAGNATVDTINPFFNFVSFISSAPIVNTDIVGLKLWASAAGDLKLIAVTIYVVPIEVQPSGLFNINSNNSNMLRTVSGAISGVTYNNTGGGTIRYLDGSENLNADTAGFATSPYLLAQPFNLIGSDVTTKASNADVAALLYRISNLIKLVYKIA